MKTPKRTSSFTGKDIYVGIDVHLRQWSVTIRTEHLTLRTFSMNPSPEELATHLQKNYPGAVYHSVYEAGFCGFWIHRALVRLGINNIVVNPADVPTTHKEKVQKRDKRDSRKLARGLAHGYLTPIYVLSEEAEALRALGRRLLQISKSQRRVKTRIKHLLHTQGIVLPSHSEISHWSANFIDWLRSQRFSSDNYHFYLDSLLEELAFLRQLRLKLYRQIRQQIKGNEVLKNLRTVPGIGFVIAFTFYTEIIDIYRFRILDELLSYLGLVPAVRASDEKEHILGLTSRGNKYLRHLLIEGAWVAIRFDPELTIAYEAQIKTKIHKKAIIRITKKLVSRMRYVWKNNQEYVIAVAE